MGKVDMLTLPLECIACGQTFGRGWWSGDADFICGDCPRIEHCRNESCLVCPHIGMSIAMMAGVPAQVIRQAMKETVRYEC